MIGPHIVKCLTDAKVEANWFVSDYERSDGLSAHAAPQASLQVDYA